MNENHNKIILSLGAYILCMVFCLQASTIGCSKKNIEDNEADGGSSDNHTAFFSDNNGLDGEHPIDWMPISENIFEQVVDLHGDDAISINSIDRNETGPSAVRCVLEPYEGNSRTRVLLNGLFLLYSDFPNQSVYVAEVDGVSVRTTWEKVSELAESGFSYDCPDADMDWYWRIINDEEEEAAMDYPVIGAESKMGSKSR